MRTLYFTLACIFFCIGFVGVFLSVVSTTPFMLLALWGFSRSSPRFHHWLYTHKIFGPPLQQWHDYRVIPPVAKFFAVFFMAASLIYLTFFSAVLVWVNIIVAFITAFGKRGHVLLRAFWENFCWYYLCSINLCNSITAR